MAGLRELLVRPFDRTEARAFVALAESVDRRIDALPARLAIDARRLAYARLAGSSSLSSFDGNREARRADLVAWAAANDTVQDLVRRDATPSFAGVAAISGKLQRLDGPAPLRSRAATFGGVTAPPPADLEALLAPMAGAVDARIREVHPIAGAALFAQWIVSTHCFDDGNGRTSRLAADWILARFGYPPASYPDLIASIVTVVADRDPPPSAAEAAHTVLQGVEHTLDLMFGPKPER